MNFIAESSKVKKFDLRRYLESLRIQLYFSFYLH